MNFERKLVKISFYRFHLRQKITNLKKSARSFQVGGNFHHVHWQPDTCINSFICNNTGPLFLDVNPYTCVFRLQDDAKNVDTAPLSFSHNFSVY